MLAITWNASKLNGYSEREESSKKEVWERRTIQSAQQNSWVSNKQTNNMDRIKILIQNIFQPRVWRAHKTTTKPFHFLFRWSEREQSRKKEGGGEKRVQWAEQMSFVIPNRTHTQRTRKLAARGGHICKYGYNQTALPENTLTQFAWGAHKTTTKPFHFLFRWSERERERGE